MSLFGKLNLLRKHYKDNNINKSNETDDKTTATATTTTTTTTKTTNNTTKKNTNNDREPTLCLGTEQVRILLFQECEWRGRRVLFDSLKLENRRTKNATSTTGTKEKTAEDTTSSLSEMVFGTVAMTYKGSSFKVHSMKSPACIICTKVFPVTEHNGPKQNERFSDGTLTRCSTHVDSNTSNSSIKTSISRPSSGNVSSSNDLLPDPRKNSSCSSNGSIWDMETQLHMGSSQSLESSGSSGVGSSLSSLRRKWLRAVSTSLSRADSDDIFGIQQYGENNSEGGDKHYRSRLGLMMLVRLTQGQERRIETRLLEHMTLLEGMLDRLRYFCIERNGLKTKTINRKSIDPADRMYRASYRFIISLLRLLINPNYFRPPLLWHDVLLNSVITLEMNSNILNRGLQQMCQLLDDVDTKSTNFFLSTVVTAVLMYHLGWVYTILPANDRQMMENLGRWYPCNPLWAQLGDLYGAMGNPIKVTHTLVVGDSRKTDLINSVLYFLSYFIRSGIVQKQREHRCAIENDIKEATNLLEQMQIKRPYLFDYTKPRNHLSNDTNRNITMTTTTIKRESRVPVQSKQTQKTFNEMQVRVNDSATISEQLHDDQSGIRSECIEEEQIRPTERSIRSLKRSKTMKVALDRYMLKTDDEPPLAESTPITKSLSMIQDERIENDEEEEEEGEVKLINQNYTQTKVKIIVNEIDSDTIEEESASNVENQTQFDIKNVTKVYKHDEVNDNTNVSSNKRVSLEVEEEVEEEEEGEAECKSKNDNGGTNNNDKTYTHQTEFLRLNDNNLIEENKRQEQVYFTLGCDDKPNRYLSRPRLGYNCQCSYMFTTLPSTSAQLPEGVLRKIIQRNFPESSKSMQPSTGTTTTMSSMESNMGSKSTRICPRCNNQSNPSSQTYKGMKELLETPTNATEVLRTCVNADRTVGMSRSNSLEALMEANSVIELPMPRSKLVSSKQVNHSNDETGFTKTLLQTKVPNTRQTNNGTWSTNYTWGLVIQGLIKKDKKRRKRRKDKTEEQEQEQQQMIESDIEDDWWCCVREEVAAGVRFPTIDEPVSEAVCILADLDTWHVGILSNNTPSEGPPLPVGMSRLVANMLEAFAYVWRKYHSPLHCVDILESKLREMWLRSEALAQMLMTADVCDVSVAALTNALDLDAADIPLLLAVATTHSPEIAQRFGLTLA
ncbi:folliculin-interacting protein 2 [Polistes fuscatus]|uniref:folliculin-interacting protein 2 n=1 Tax=Polistes fuscatus TaxID=30207 RepID=UPI001CA7C562|nr:folliculin-interacting protein 2 [Polistes fuscatus]XP_043492119.1 folliculin-interacting protein 2 [Polistes fuscatus]